MKTYYLIDEYTNSARALFNAAALHNSSSHEQQKAFDWLGDCQSIAAQHKLQGVLSHCYAFRGTHLYQIGEFKTAIHQFHQALRSMPSHEHSFRRLHVLSMLTLSYFQKDAIKPPINTPIKLVNLQKKTLLIGFKLGMKP